MPICENDTEGFLKVITRTDDTILGATVVAGRAGEVITEFVLRPPEQASFEGSGGCDAPLSHLCHSRATDGCRRHRRPHASWRSRQGHPRLIETVAVTNLSGEPMEKDTSTTEPLQKKDADYIFYELTRSICPECRRVIDAQILLRDNKVYMRKRCPQCGPFEGLVYGDAALYVSQSKYNKAGTIPLAFGTDIRDGCPYDCGLCPDHQQHACLGIIEVNSACNMDCPLCFSEAGPGFSLTLEEVEHILDDFVRTEGDPEVVQFSGGEPTIHPQIVDFVNAAKARGIRVRNDQHEREADRSR